MKPLRILTPAQYRTLRWLHRHGGSGVLDRYGRVVAGGEPMGTSGGTWVCLMAWGMVAGGSGRVELTPFGARTVDLMGAVPGMAEET